MPHVAENLLSFENSPPNREAQMSPKRYAADMLPPVTAPTKNEIQNIILKKSRAALYQPLPHPRVAR